MALWFAARGTAASRTAPALQNDSSCATSTVVNRSPRILLVGMGADEQMGGYGRHRKAAEQGRLEEELQIDMDRLWERNLGRDDRLVADHGREARFPFLDNDVVQYLTHLRANDANTLLCDFDLPPGEGDKRILRLVAHRLGIPTAAGLVKRAIQFGSRVSQVSDKHRFGSRRQTKGQYNLPKGGG
uniref:Asparagine synthetase domain-containing protein n=1 Tax=Grammatophora oceanica TaxID=210454 RepID=A0A7S1UVW3_9STRA|mmetsp:Transcript_25882/g.37905  ORF Transcript_25882/g.37905 Transcript_25882/m.37905 type:complete len:186 (+) Transcript_25882:104-661(+)|eukprot:CAMPEP_0194064708 /NCGR_PEP_ID=MMETSP0009_2-20130614/83720_1 /TAXON_ID=210454 /ORGANISM="Grammatophora oceanica, Strain CCMP 410" /LENGTH=185 /DNA_ID=CAMNT_0038717287 /DNA_START=47 /DNA_END=604 /DNA_ORIENTATION=+